MTTIAADPVRGVMVCDSQTSDGDQKWPENKVERIGGALYSACGFASDAELFYAWIRKGKRGAKPVLDADAFNALALTKHGLYWYDHKLVPMLRHEPAAIGSGGKCVMAAMLVGADIITAVEAACQVDANSDGPVVVHYLHKKLKKG